MVMGNYTPKAAQEKPEPRAMKCLRIDIPIDPYDDLLMRDVAEEIRALAYQIEFWAKLDRAQEEKETMTRKKVNNANSCIRGFGKTKGYFWRAGRPKAAELGWDEPEDEPLRLVDGR